MNRLLATLAAAVSVPAIVLFGLTGSVSARPVPDVGSVRRLPIEIVTTGLDRSDAPGISYLRGKGDQGDDVWRLRRADGSELRVPSGWRDFTTLGRGAIGTYGSEAGVVIERVSGDGTVTSSRSGFEHYGLVTTPDHSIVGYLDNHERLVVLEDAGRRQLRFGQVRGADKVSAILGTGRCRHRQTEVGGCTVFFNRPNERGVRYTTSHGITDNLPVLRSVSDAARPRRLVGISSKRPRCSGLLVRPDRLRWTQCDVELTDFSPNGRRVLGADDPYGPGTIAVFEVAGDGTPIVEFTFVASSLTGQERRMTDVVWEDDSHLLAVVFDRVHWSVLRLGLDGSVERATRRLLGIVDESRFRLPIR